jgi:hypothetical protein
MTDNTAKPERIKRISKKEQVHIAAAAHAARLGEAVNHIEVAQHTGFHSVDAANILRNHAQMYNQTTVDWYGRPEAGR